MSRVYEKLGVRPLINAAGTQTRYGGVPLPEKEDVMGNPLVASAEKGERLFNAIVGKLVQLVTEMHHAPVRQYKEFGRHCP